ncbi:ruBisCO operon transcriptional regulator [Geobacter sp. OR-1]|uniref:LysR family transcriptional regulator n=1 Tax=Geobacter sp. OR-1 TaxID=1266765 RepID=UPI000542D5B5|nr:LysR family transcriptional regulator [Geobacter sp. OR-1]GAM08663.1 ruBisCO operon transcriptional regulator [Geobacter sp. OR-1]
MNIKQLEVFVAIVESGSFSKGAEAVCLTQSTASQHIAALEQAAGVRLLDRTGRGAVPTQAGKTLLHSSRKVLAALRGAEQAIRRFSCAEDVELRVAGSSIPGTYLIPEAVALLRRQAPGIKVIADIRDSREALALLRDETVELAVVGAPSEDSAFESEVVGNDTVRLVVKRGHPWGEAGRIDVCELKSEVLVAREQGSGTGRAVAELLRQAGIDGRELKIGAVFSTSEAVKQAVIAGCGPAFLSEVAVAGELAAGDLIAIDLGGITQKRLFSLVWRRGRSLSPAAEKFRAVLRQTMPV